MLQSSLVELDWTNLRSLKVDLKLLIILSEFDHLNDLHDHFSDVRFYVSGNEAALLNYTQVKEVICVQHEHLSRDKDRLGCLFHHNVLL